MQNFEDAGYQAEKPVEIQGDAALTRRIAPIALYHGLEAARFGAAVGLEYLHY